MFRLPMKGASALMIPVYRARRAAVSNRRPLTLYALPVLASLAFGIGSEARADVTVTVAAANTAANYDGPTPSALSREDRLTYTTAFDALRRGDLESARETARRAQDRILLGQVEFERLFHANHVATYEELVAWLAEYSDLPMAERVYTLAMRRLPDGATPPSRPGNILARTWDSVARSGHAADPAKAARVMLNNDDLQNAYTTGLEIGDLWSAALAAWRLGEFNNAFRAFEQVANDPTEDPWVRAGGAFWASRAAGQSGRQDRIAEMLRIAARWPATFYGQIALRQLGEEPEILNIGPRSYMAETQRHQVYEPNPVPNGDLNAFVQNDAHARRALALYEVGRRTDAAATAREGMRQARDFQQRQLWSGLYRLVAPSRAADRAASRIDAADYPLPDLMPEGGFTVERALVYALVRKESGFNASARSHAGAYGIMQVMPSTAAYMTGDQSYTRQPQRLLDASHNLKLGQEYINRLLQIESFQGDLLKTVASYNAGPGPMLAAIRKLGPTTDPLLLIETIDVPEARDYVEKVVAAYWIYQRLLGGPLNTLDAAASGATSVPLRLDYRPPAPQPLQAAEAAVPSTGR